MELFNTSQEKELSIREKELDIRKKEIELDAGKFSQDTQRPKQLELDETFTRIMTISAVSALLTYKTVDEEKTLFASEPFLRPAFSAESRLLIEKKVMTLLKEL